MKYHFFDNFRSFIKQTLIFESHSITTISDFFLNKKRKEKQLRSIFTPIDEAVTEIKKRRSDPTLCKKIDDYLEGCIPDHFLQETPIFYLSRFLATPNYELMHVHELTKKYSLPLVVGEDIKSKFSPNNELKLALGKLPIIKGTSSNGDDIVEYTTIVDFSQNQGKSLDAIQTKFDISLVDFHRSLFLEANLQDIKVVDETKWVDYIGRDNVFLQYKKMWAILCVHGIMLESFTPVEFDFFEQVAYRSFKEIERELGVKPLIVEHITTEEETRRNWNSYPDTVSDSIKKLMGEKY